MASIDRRGSGWRVRWRDPDGEARSRVAPTLVSAKRLARDVEQEAAEGRRWEPSAARPRVDLDEVLTAHVRDCIRRLRASTATRRAENLDVFVRWLREREGRRRRLDVELLTKGLLAEYYDWLRGPNGRHGRPRSIDTAKKMVSAVQLAWAWAFNDDELGDEIPRPRALAMPGQDGEPTRAASFAEADACVRACKGWHRKVALILRYTGLRVGQVMALRWDDVDLAAATLRIRGELGKSRSERRGRIVPLSGHLVEELATWGRREGFLVESNRQRGGPRERTFRAREMARAWARAGVREEVWARRPDHAFRKCLVSGLKRLGADADAVELLVGHKLPGERGVYLDPDYAPLREAVALIPRVEETGAVHSLDEARGGKRGSGAR